jgi:shikimate kinase
MLLSLIGMSGSGKSTWSGKLEKAGFKRFCCDDMITEKLHSELIRPDGTIMELGEWMGFPFDGTYKERETKYLSCEIESLRGIFDYLKNGEGFFEQDIVVDTTGSVIYTGDEMLDRLRRHTTVVHLATPPEIHELMLNVYLIDKRPVLWNDLFSRKPNETADDALARCYPKLLSTRERLYEKHGDVTIGFHEHNRENFDIEAFLKAVERG